MAANFENFRLSDLLALFVFQQLQWKLDVELLGQLMPNL
jgi:hypothetical protein